MSAVIPHVLPSLMQQYIHASRYARWDYEKKRRETWPETVARYIDFMRTETKQLVGAMPEEVLIELQSAMQRTDVMPSMRALMTAGEALRRDHIAGYNCAFVAIDRVTAFDEILYILMCGTGVGFTVERDQVAKLPVVAEEFHQTDTTLVVADSKLGWAKSFKELLSLLWAGQIPKWDVSRVRPAGAPLKTFGGRASGPEPLVSLFKYAVEQFKSAAGRKLTPIECHDLVCMIADIVVVGGVRRAALISLSDLDDQSMRHAKSGQWWVKSAHRALSNNSAIYERRPDAETFLREWTALVESKSGERGIINRKAFREKNAEIGRDNDHPFGCNPCAEIILRPNEFCNLSEVVVRSDDTWESLKKKVELATIIGTFQSLLTNFRYISNRWRKNCDEERLLGVSLTGIMDNELTSGRAGGLAEGLSMLRDHARKVNELWAKTFDINPSAAITCVKPSGCRPWDGLVTTDRGIYTLEDLILRYHVDTQAQWASVENLRAPGAQSVTKTYVNGMAATKLVRMTYGLEVVSTANHQWFVKDRGWVRADDLRAGDHLEISVGEYRNEIDAPLKTMNMDVVHARSDVSPFNQPGCMNPDLGWLLGYLWGDGAMSPAKFRLRWIDQREINLVKAQRILHEQFGLETTIQLASGARNAKVLEVGSKGLWHWLIKNDVWKYHADRIDVIPRVVRESSRETIIAFLAGMIDADGWFGIKNGRPGGLTFTTADKSFANHFQHVAMAVGLCFGRSLNVGGENLQTVKEMYLMALNGHSQTSALDVLSRHSTKITTELQAYGGRTMLPLGRVEIVEDGEVVPTFDVETETHWFYAGAVKSHNTVSQLVDSASGIHPRYSQYYIRRVRADRKDPLAQFMISNSFPYNFEGRKDDAKVLVFDFPVKGPDHAVYRNDMTALQQLEHWLVYRNAWCDHNPSTTIYVRDHEWMEVGAWVYKHFDEIGGLSFLPHSDHIYDLAPYEEIDAATYDKLVAEMPKDIDWKLLAHFEESDMTAGVQTLACTGGACEL